MDELNQVSNPNGAHGMHGEQNMGMHDEENYDTPDTAKDDSNSIYTLSDVPLIVSVELGQSEITIHDLLQIQSGSVIELDKLAGEPLEVLVNGRLVSRGEVVVINENYGLRLTDIINPDDQSKVKTQDD